MQSTPCKALSKEKFMYDYREMTLEQQRLIVEDRRRKHQPWHSPPHREVAGNCYYLLTAACYEHLPIISQSIERMSECEESVLAACRAGNAEIHAWCILPNHYHLLLRTENLSEVLGALGNFHGRSSFAWNGLDGQRGRKCWYNVFERYIRSARHFWASLNYVHNNPVHHQYVSKWQDWPWSSAAEFLAQHGREETLRLWQAYPLHDYGRKWDIY